MNLSSHSPPIELNRRENRFDFLRIFAAWLVLFSHCYPLGGWPSEEPLAKTVGIDTLGGIGVAIFFVLSGYLVTISLERSPNLLVFIRRRIVRIYPALIVVCLLSILGLGLSTTSLPWSDYLHHEATWGYLKVATGWNIEYSLPGVFAEVPLPNAVNGSLWSLPYELQCYLALMAISLLPLRLRIKLLITFALLALVIVLRPTVPPADPFRPFWSLDYYHCKLGLHFTMGALFASWRDTLTPRVWMAFSLTGIAFALPGGNVQQLVFFTGLGILVIWLALNAHWLPVIPSRMGDWSYGTYLYGFPVQQLLAHWGLHDAGFGYFLATSTALTLALAGMSWHLVEKPALRWK